MNWMCQQIWGKERVKKGQRGWANGDMCLFDKGRNECFAVKIIQANWTKGKVSEIQYTKLKNTVSNYKINSEILLFILNREFEWNEQKTTLNVLKMPFFHFLRSLFISPIHSEFIYLLFPHSIRPIPAGVSLGFKFANNSAMDWLPFLEIWSPKGERKVNNTIRSSGENKGSSGRKKAKYRESSERGKITNEKSDRMYCYKRTKKVFSKAFSILFSYINMKQMGKL